jgi:transcription elongation GreA/GreB family factor
MSVAFRRESDEEHLEPKFELPIRPGPNLVTSRGLKLIEAKVAELEALTEPDDERKRELRYWRARLATAQLAPPPADDEVGFGSRVRVRLNGAERALEIVGDDEADPAAGRIAFSAPLARALIGAGEGELLPFGGREDALEVVAIGAP